MNKKLTFLLAFLFLFSGSVYMARNWELQLQQSISGSVYGDDFQDGMDAVNRGDYKTAYKLWLPLAESGEVKAQYTLGHMYYTGRGVPKDYKEALRLFRLSAKQGNANAQHNLGVMYVKGVGVTQDYLLAHMWFNLSASNGNKYAVRSRNKVENKITKQQIMQAQEMARNWELQQQSKGIFEQLKEKFWIK